MLISQPALKVSLNCNQTANFLHVGTKKVAVGLRCSILQCSGRVCLVFNCLLVNTRVVSVYCAGVSGTGHDRFGASSRNHRKFLTWSVPTVLICAVEVIHALTVTC